MNPIPAEFGLTCPRCGMPGLVGRTNMQAQFPNIHVECFSCRQFETPRIMVPQGEQGSAKFKDMAVRETLKALGITSEQWMRLRLLVALRERARRA